MSLDKVINLVNDFGFPVVLVVLMGYFIYFMFKYVTKELKPKLFEAHKVLIKLIDRIRMLDNDLIRLRTKMDTVKRQKQKKDLQ
jgi:hypothetical protein